mmetsp:Transcript_3580/g.7769  ORF Transcript_3580/g.7769 Transcript_3580/m.7769 type:complete len:278 (-) Transcript_3580:952-1785(-)
MIIRSIIITCLVPCCHMRCAARSMQCVVCHMQCTARHMQCTACHTQTTHLSCTRVHSSLQELPLMSAVCNSLGGPQSSSRRCAISSSRAARSLQIMERPRSSTTTWGCWGCWSPATRWPALWAPQLLMVSAVAPLPMEPLVLDSPPTLCTPLQLLPPSLGATLARDGASGSRSIMLLRRTSRCSTWCECSCRRASSAASCTSGVRLPSMPDSVTPGTSSITSVLITPHPGISSSPTPYRVGMTLPCSSSSTWYMHASYQHSAVRSSWNTLIAAGLPP